LNEVDFTVAIGDKSVMTTTTPKLAAIIVAAGTGSRMAQDTPKQFLDLCGKPVLCHSVDAFLSHAGISELVIVGAADQLSRIDEAIKIDGSAISRTKARVQIVSGGARRQESVRAGLEALADTGTDLVAIHDAARPLLDHGIINNLVAALHAGADAALPVMPVVDTLKSVEGEQINGTVDRATLRAAQTPQIFRLAKIKELHDRFRDDEDFTDDISMAEAAGLVIRSISGEQKLMKLTHETDFLILDALARQNNEQGDQQPMTAPDIRVGNGFDVHKFSDAPGPIMLAGVSVPSDRGMLAHSDGDVGLHALCDAIFGALGDGDIGFHFPPSDPQWQGKDSAHFLAFAVGRCRHYGASLQHLDLTIICETPKITPHRDAMRSRIAEITGLAVERIGVKATTSEGLGFTGRGEGIAAQASATVLFGAST